MTGGSKEGIFRLRHQDLEKNLIGNLPVLPLKNMRKSAYLEPLSGHLRFVVGNFCPKR